MRPCGLTTGYDVTIIPLAPPSLAGSSSLPGSWERAVPLTRAGGCPPAVNAPLFGLAPCGVLPATRVATGAVRSYHLHSYPPCPPGSSGGIFSVPLSFRLPCRGFPALPWSSDFPPHLHPSGYCATRPAETARQRAEAREAGGDRLASCEIIIRRFRAMPLFYFVDCCAADDFGRLMFQPFSRSLPTRNACRTSRTRAGSRGAPSRRRRLDLAVRLGRCRANHRRR